MHHSLYWPFDLSEQGKKHLKNIDMIFEQHKQYNKSYFNDIADNEANSDSWEIICKSLNSS